MAGLYASDLRQGDACAAVAHRLLGQLPRGRLSPLTIGWPSILLIGSSSKSSPIRCVPVPAPFLGGRAARPREGPPRTDCDRRSLGPSWAIQGTSDVLALFGRALGATGQESWSKGRVLVWRAVRNGCAAPAVERSLPAKEASARLACDGRHHWHRSRGPTSDGHGYRLPLSAAPCGPRIDRLAPPER